MPKLNIANALRISPLNNRYPALHGIRSFIAVLVIAYHVRPLPTSWYPRLWFSMDLFFVMSGFLISLILLYSLDKGHLTVARFYIRRAFRTFPLYFFVLGFATMFLPLEPEAISKVWREFAYITNFYDISKDKFVMFWGWSLCVEEHFYLACPLLLYGMRHTRRHEIRIGILIFTILLILALRLYFISTDPFGEVTLDASYYQTQFRIDEFAFGILAGYLTYFFPAKITQMFSRKIVRLTVLALISTSFILSFMTPATSIYRAFGFTFASFGYFCAILYALNVKNLIISFLSHHMFLTLATLSYGVYLVHQYVLSFMIDPLFANSPQFVTGQNNIYIWSMKLIGTFALSLVISYVMHILIEKPALIVRDWITNEH